MFKETFKYYKRKVPPPDLTKVLDLSVDNIDFNKVTVRTPCDDFENVNESLWFNLGLIPVAQWKIYELISHPGLIYIVNPFTSIGQKLWIYKALSQYPRPPNKLNLHAHNDLTVDEDWWQICQSNEERKKILYKKLRWVTLGYHHNWDTKVYSEEERSQFPNDLKVLSQKVVKAACGYELEAQAAIVNYYHIGSTLSGHTDHSEPNRQAPLVSFSFGQEALFMIGGETLDDKCETILVKSGDILVMSGSSRLCYHGVPLIRQTQYKPWNNDDSLPCHSSWLPFQHYITTSRININVRQVLPIGYNHLDSN